MRFHVHPLLVVALAMVWAMPGLAQAGMLTFTFDDGLVSVYEHGFPVLQQRGVNATVGVIARKIVSDDDPYMTVAQAKTLAQNGWEIASHGWNHERVSDVPAFFSQEVIPNWKPRQCDPAVFRAHYPYKEIAVLYAGDGELKPRASYDDMVASPGSYFFDEIIEELYVHLPAPPAPGQMPVIRSTSYEREMQQSQKELNDLGFTVTSYVRPYNFWTKESQAFGHKYYQAITGPESDLNRKATFSPQNIARINIHADTTAAALIDVLQREVAGKETWLVLCLHGVEEKVGYEPWPASQLAAVADWCLQHGVRIVTLGQGARLLAEQAAKPGPAQKRTGAKGKK